MVIASLRSRVENRIFLDSLNEIDRAKQVNGNNVFGEINF